MRDYADIISQIRIAAIGVKKQSNRLTLMQDAADAIEELLAAVPKWISVEKRLPEENKNYLCYGVFLPLGVKAMDMYRFDGVRWRTSSDVEITHWMPLPEPPKEETE